VKAKAKRPEANRPEAKNTEAQRFRASKSDKPEVKEFTSPALRRSI